MTTNIARLSKRTNSWDYWSYQSPRRRKQGNGRFVIWTMVKKKKEMICKQCNIPTQILQEKLFSVSVEIAWMNKEQARRRTHNTGIDIEERVEEWKVPWSGILNVVYVISRSVLSWCWVIQNYSRSYFEFFTFITVI
jgi:hypothetical protein